MLKFVKHHLDTIAGVGIYPAMSFLVFFLFFLGMLWWVFTVRKSHIEHMAALPIEPDTRTNAHSRHAH